MDLEGNLASGQGAHARDADELARIREQLSMSRASADTRRQTPPTKPASCSHRLVSALRWV